MRSTARTVSLNAGVFVLAVIVIASCACQAGTEESQSSEVTLSIDEAIQVDMWPASEINVPGGIIPGGENVAGPYTFTVKCNTTWGIKVRSLTSEGTLKEYNTTDGMYESNGSVLQQPVQFGTSATGPWTDLSGTPALLCGGQAPTDDAGTTVDMYLHIPVLFSDRPLTNGNIYRIELLYSVGVGY